MSLYRDVQRCRLCGGARLSEVFSLGVQALTGVFPKSEPEKMPAGPVDLVKCGAPACGLVQLRQSYDKSKMYGDNYGYRSGLNPSMVRHLEGRARKLRGLVQLKTGDVVVDIGSNDGTLLKSYGVKDALYVGVDPAAERFARYYPPNARRIADFFSADRLAAEIGGQKARIVTSIAMFYDLDAPQDFAAQIARTLADDGVWMFEQSYLPAMLKQNAYDTICHEHLEYYGLKQVRRIAEGAGLKIVDVEFNDVNGGSFCVTAAKRQAPYPEADLSQLLEKEEEETSDRALAAFQDRVLRHREGLRAFFRRAKEQGKTVAGYGASTKGNVILQFCGITKQELPEIGDVNEDKFGSFTPGTGIPIVSERELRARRPDILFVLPWHFRDFIVEKEAAFLKAGGKLYFPLPEGELVG